MTPKRIYHGSRFLVENPVYGKGSIYNDYGLGFYCTESAEMAKEWSVSDGLDGFVNAYEIDLEGLKVLHLNQGDYHILNWLAILLENRTFDVDSELMLTMKEYIIRTFLPDYKGYDVILGYRADDSYFSFAKAFLNNAISLHKLEEAMRLGQLGEQLVVKSELAFSRVSFLDAKSVSHLEYYPKRKRRDDLAREEYRRMRVNIEEGVFALDIYREKWRDDDVRLQRILY